MYIETLYVGYICYLTKRVLESCMLMLESVLFYDVSFRKAIEINGSISCELLLTIRTDEIAHARLDER